LEKKIYDINNIQNTYPNYTFTEFLPISSDLDSTAISSSLYGRYLQATITDLSNQLTVASSSINNLQTQASNYSQLQALATTQASLIINFRILRGEGKTPADFETTYPYLPLSSVGTNNVTSSVIT
jgi:hypothetical protein